MTDPCGHSYAAGALMGLSADQGEAPGQSPLTHGLARESLAAVVAELEAYRPACWHTSRAAVVRVVAGELRFAEA